MGTYKDEIPISYNPDEALRRIERWLQGEGRNFQVDNGYFEGIKLRWPHGFQADIIFHLKLGHQKIHTECWVNGPPKMSIAELSLFGGLPRRKGWKMYMSLKNVLTEDVGSLPPDIL